MKLILAFVTRPALLGGVLMSLALVLSGCSGSKNLAGAADPTGVYTLESVDGVKVPTTVKHEGAKLDIRAGTFVIDANGTCLSKMTFVPPDGKERTQEVKATYTQQGSKLEMRWEGAGMTTGNVGPGTFTMKNEGMTLAYKK